MYHKSRLTFAKAVDKIHSYFGIETKLVRKLKNGWSADVILAMDNEKLKSNTAIAAIIENFWWSYRDQIKNIIFDTPCDNLLSYSQLIIAHLILLLLDDWQNKINSWNDDNVKKLMEYTKNNNDLIEVLRIQFGPWVNPECYDWLNRVGSWIKTAVKNIIGALDVYHRLWWKTDKQSMLDWIREHILAMASLNVYLIDLIEDQYYEWYVDIFKSFNEMWRGEHGWKKFDTEKFYIDEKWKLQVNSKVYYEWLFTNEDLIEKAINLENKKIWTKCPALFSMVTKWSKKKNVIIDLCEMLTERYTTVYMKKL